MQKRKLKAKKLLLIMIIPSLLFALVVVSNALVVGQTKNNIFNNDEKIYSESVDAIIVLGAGLKANGEPNHILEDRLKTAISLYNDGVADRIIMSGDHGSEEYDEVNAMKKYAVDCGVPSDSIFLDHAGFCTYDSIYRAKEIFGVKMAVIVTQRYHLFRSLYISERLGIEAVGVSADLRSYTKGAYREAREIIARTKDFINCIFMPEPKYLGDKIDLASSGEITNG